MQASWDNVTAQSPPTAAFRVPSPSLKKPYGMRIRLTGNFAERVGSPKARLKASVPEDSEL